MTAAYRDSLEILNHNLPLSVKLSEVHRVVHQHHPYVERIAVAIHDPHTDLLKTFIHSSGKDSPLIHYQAKLGDSESLSTLAKEGVPRILNNLQIFANNSKEHSEKIRGAGYLASYTLPMYSHDEFHGFVFFNSRQAGVFEPTVLHYLDLVGHLLALAVMEELHSLQTIAAAVKTARDMAHKRDNETGSHLDRMSRYARIIARGLAEKFKLSDEDIEHLFMYAPLHDIGKIGIPDRILLKPGRLDHSEFEIMKTHARKGRELIDEMLSNFGMAGLQRADMLRNIAEFHHEAVNGQGYPDGLKGDQVPIEARIVAVADIFDALTSQRPYKPAWDNEQAFALLRQMAGESVDADCVQALLDHRTEVERIQQLFREDTIG